MTERDGILVDPAGASRCWGSGQDPLYGRYHDRGWGRPVRADRRLFEKLCLEGWPIRAEVRAQRQRFCPPR